MCNNEMLTILFNNGERKNIWVDLNEVLSIYVKVVSGDELVTIIYKNGKIEIFDPGKDTRKFYKLEGEYYIYLPSKKVNFIDMFNVEHSSHDVLDTAWR